MGRRNFAHVKYVQPVFRTGLIVSALPIERVGRDAKTVLHGERHASRLMIFQFGDGDKDIAVGIGVVQIVSWVDTSAPRHLYPEIVLHAPHVARGFELNRGLEGTKGVDIPACRTQGSFQGAGEFAAFQDSDSLRSSAIEDNRQSVYEAGMHLICAPRGKPTKWLP